MNLRFLAATAACACAALATTATTAARADERPAGAPAASAGESPAKPASAIDPRSRFLWLDAEGGIQSANLSTFSQDWERFSVGFLPRDGTGPMAGAAVGVRIVFLTLGVRGRVASFQNTNRGQTVDGWNMSSLDGEVGFRAPLGRLEPSLTVAGGYTTFGGFGSALRGVRNGINVNGFNARAGLGVDYFVHEHISIGALASAELLALSRPGIPTRSVLALPQSESIPEASARFLAANGSTYGAALSLTGGLKAHF